MSTDVDPILAVGAVVAALLAGAPLALVVAPRVRALLMLGALVLTPVLLLAEIWDTDQIESLRGRPVVALVAAALGVVAVAAVALLLHRRPMLFPALAVAALPFRIPIAAGGSTASLLVPLYLVIAAGVLAYAVPRLRGAPETDAEPEPEGVWVRRFLALSLVLYAAQASYSSDFERALQQVVFFYVPFTLLATLLARVSWTRPVLERCLAVLVALSVVFVSIGFVEYATRHILLNPKVIASNQFEEYFRVNSLFFDPNIYGRFLAIVMLLVAAVLLWERRPRVTVACGVLLALFWAGLVLTLSQSSFTALLAGLVVLAALRWGTRPAAIAAGAVLLAGIVVVLATPSSFGLDRDANDASSGRLDLIEGGVRLAGDAPVAGHGSGSFRREYRRNENATGERATNASHTIPITVGAEQGIPGLLVYLGLLGTALTLLLRRARDSIARAGVAAAFVALVVHTLMYAAFLEDPLTWALLGIGIGLASRPGDRPAKPEPEPQDRESRRARRRAATA
ncbi:MAG TPA: O-antigen ligase family protein [Solirubrobacteraceae bacterium]|nr:O-antigen ligase family protein [Solirubrobacteraceae bacterium]